MRDLETMFRQTDYSQYTDLKERLASRLFGKKTSSKVISFPFQRISDEEAELVAAARGITDPLQDRINVTKQDPMINDPDLGV